MKKIIGTLLLSIVISLYSCKHKEYYDNGVLKTIGTLKNNKKIGKWKYYSNEGLLYLEENYKNNIRDGQRRQYYKSGNIMLEGAIKKNRLIGKWKEYYKNGQLKSEGLYGDKREKDTWFLFGEFFKTKIFLLKEKKQVFKYSNNPNYILKTGIEKGTDEWHNIKENLFQIPNKEGNWTYYFNSGEVESEEIYRDDNVIMECGYYKNGQLSRIEEPYYTGEYNEMGKDYLYELRDDFFKEYYSETGQLTYYANNGTTINIEYENEQLKTKDTRFKNGNTIKENYRNGQIEIKRTYKKRYSKTEEYKNGQLETTETHFKNGKIVKEKYKNGQIQKKTTNNYKKGDSKKEEYKNGQLETIHIYTSKDRRLKVYDKSRKLISNKYIPINCTNFIGIWF